MNRSWRRRAWLALSAIVLILVVLFTAADAWARIGGGQSFGGGGGGSRGGGSSSNGGEIELVFFLIQLCIEVPMIGIPLTMLVVLFAGFHYWDKSKSKTHMVYDHGQTAAPPPAKPRRSGLTKLREADRGFSMPVLLDFLILVHRRATAATATQEWAPLAPFVSEEARAVLSKTWAGSKEVRDICVGSTDLRAVRKRGGRFELVVRFESTRFVDSRHLYVVEDWTLARDASASSLAPEAVMRMGCPSCGAAVETTPMGACTTCDSPITKGQLQWQVTGVSIVERRAAQPPQLGAHSGGVEPSARMPTRFDPGLGHELRKLRARHPDFVMDAFEQRVRDVYLILQQAWSDNAESAIRPFVTDPLFQTLRFWIEGYKRAKLQNRLDRVQMGQLQIVKVEVDAWYESVTVRLFGSMVDSTVDASGKVVGGNAKVERRFSEYWTFVRASASGGLVHDTLHCPSCGAPLDQVSAAGICGYCDTKITTGHHDWVLSRIDQCETYRG